MTPAPDLAVVLGTRPEVIKLGPVIERLGSRVEVIWTGQHYDPSLTDAFFADIGRPRPATSVQGVGGASRARQFATMLGSLAERFDRSPPAAVLVQGDTNTASAAAQAAHYCGVPVVHVEAGLRAFDRRMPEEINRQVIGVVADLHCCATEGNAVHLRRAGVADEAIRVTGNTIVEVTLARLPGERSRAEVLANAGLVADAYVLSTIHRPENTDNPVRLRMVLEGLGNLPWPVVLPLHPRTRHRIEQFSLGHLIAPLTVIEPIDHPAFLAMARHARVIVSDSGGVQEEVTVLKRPLVVVRNSTERPESIAAGFAMLTAPEAIEGAVESLGRAEVALRLGGVPCPFGDVHAAERIAAATIALVDAPERSSRVTPFRANREPAPAGTR